MAHNPILESFPKFSDGSYRVPMNTRGVLLRNQQTPQILEPGQGLNISFREKLISNNIYSLFVIDMLPHEMTWRLSLPAKIADGSIAANDLFSVTIQMQYQVTDPLKMVQGMVKDTEKLVIQAVDRDLRKTAQRYELVQPEELDAALTQYLDAVDLSSCGLQRMGVASVTVERAEEMIRRINERRRQKQEAEHQRELEEQQRQRQEKEAEKARKTPHLAEHVERVPSSKKGWDFSVTVSVTYMIKDPMEIPNDLPETAEQYLYPRIRGRLKHVEKKHNLEDITEVHEALQSQMDELLEKGLSDFGIRVTDIRVAVDLDEATRKRYLEMAEQEHQLAIEKMRLAGSREANALSLEALKDAMVQGSLGPLVIAASRGEISMEALSKELSEREMKRFEELMKILETTREGNIRNERQDYEVGQQVLNTLVEEVTKKPGKPALQSSGEPPKELPPSVNH